MCNMKEPLMRFRKSWIKPSLTSVIKHTLTSLTNVHCGSIGLQRRKGASFELWVDKRHVILYLKVVQRLKFSIGIRTNKMPFLILPIVFRKSDCGKIPPLNQTLGSRWEARNILIQDGQMVPFWLPFQTKFGMPLLTMILQIMAMRSNQEAETPFIWKAAQEMLVSIYNPSRYNQTK